MWLRAIFNAPGYSVKFTAVLAHPRTTQRRRKQRVRGRDSELFGIWYGRRMRVQSFNCCRALRYPRGSDERYGITEGSPLDAVELEVRHPGDQHNGPQGGADRRPDHVRLDHLLLLERLPDECFSKEPDRIHQPKKRQREETAPVVPPTQPQLLVVLDFSQVHFRGPSWPF